MEKTEATRLVKRLKTRIVLSFVILAMACLPVSNDAEMSPRDKAAVVDAAKRDLAQRLGIKEQTIELVGQVEEVTWPDASLGCPEPGKMYAQVLTPGHKLTLRSGGKLYEYHAAKGVVKLCQQ